MKFILVVAIYSATTGLTLRTHSEPYSKEECETFAAAVKAQASTVTLVEARCVGVAP